VDPLRPDSVPPAALSLSTTEATSSRLRRSPAWAFASGALIGLVGGMVGLGGAEFRLPILLAVFGFAGLQAVILNKTMSLVVVAAALPARLLAVPPGDLADEWTVITNLLAGSLFGAWLGATWAVRMRTATLYRVLAVLLVLIATVLAANDAGTVDEADLSDGVRVVAGVAAGILIGIVAALMGVAGGELLIPTIVLLYGLDIKLAGSVGLAVSLPTMLVAFARYSRDSSFVVLRQNRRFALAMAGGSVVGTVAGGLLLGVVSGAVLVPLLCGLLLVSSVKVWNHR
jgi:uncharacterized membrane protein YfcA